MVRESAKRVLPELTNLPPAVDPTQLSTSKAVNITNVQTPRPKRKRPVGHEDDPLYNAAIKCLAIPPTEKQKVDEYSCKGQSWGFRLRTSRKKMKHKVL